MQCSDTKVLANYSSSCPSFSLPLSISMNGYNECLRERQAVRAKCEIRFFHPVALSHLAQTACLSSFSTLQGDHLQGSWTVLPHGISSQNHCDYLSLQRSLWLYDDDTQCQLTSSSVGSWPGSTLEDWLKLLVGKATGY